VIRRSRWPKGRGDIASERSDKIGLFSRKRNAEINHRLSVRERSLRRLAIIWQTENMDDRNGFMGEKLFAVGCKNGIIFLNIVSNVR
jgi:hypothetical protein